MKITEDTYVKANRRASRNEEIRLYGKQISNRQVVHKSKKQYNRQRDKKVPLFLYNHTCSNILL
jgi:hypothetical protein